MAELSNPVNWFEIPVTDIARAKAFYEAALEIELTEHEMGPTKMAWFPMHSGGSGATGSLVQSEHHKPSQDGTLIYLSVPSIEPALERIAAAGGATIVPKTSIGEHGFFAVFLDSEGGRVALHEPASP